MRVLFFGDIVGRPGRRAIAALAQRWRVAHRADFVIANGENSAAGMGITPQIAEELFAAGVDVITTGNHVFSKKEVIGLLEHNTRVLRPANYPPGVPGRGHGVYDTGVGLLGVINLMGRTFMTPLDDPFRALDTAIALTKRETGCILLDIHAEATSEKGALGWYADGRVSAVIGTHTHVQTSDERILPGGTAFLTDVGMVGPRDSVLGVKVGIITERFLTQMPSHFDVEERGPVSVGAVLVEIDVTSGHAQQIVRLYEEVDLPAAG